MIRHSILQKSNAVYASVLPQCARYTSQRAVAPQERSLWIDPSQSAQTLPISATRTQHNPPNNHPAPMSLWSAHCALRVVQLSGRIVFNLTMKDAIVSFPHYIFRPVLSCPSQRQMGWSVCGTPALISGGHTTQRSASLVTSHHFLSQRPIVRGFLSGK